MEMKKKELVLTPKERDVEIAQMEETKEEAKSLEPLGNKEEKQGHHNIPLFSIVENKNVST